MGNPIQQPRRHEQLLLDWSAPAPQQTPEPMLPALIPVPETAETSMPERTGLVPVLPWDFRLSFPQIPDAAIEAGKIYEDDATPDNIKALHEEHAQHGLVILATLDALLDAKCRGVDPRNGRAPRTPKQREALEEIFREEPARLERSFNMLMDAYEDVFGAEAADAFGKAIRAWHAGIEVIAKHPPSPSPLPASVQGGVFGVEEDGTPIEPEPEEVEAITEIVANELLEETDEQSRQPLLQKYAEDFGQPAAAQLDKWVKRKVTADEGVEFNYDPGHSWHYYHEGDAAEPPLLADIPARSTTESQVGTKFPKHPAKRRLLLERVAAEQHHQLVEDERRYQELVERGVDALSRYDREISSGGNEALAWATAIALKYSHICGGPGACPMAGEGTENKRTPKRSWSRAKRFVLATGQLLTARARGSPRHFPDRPTLRNTPHLNRIAPPFGFWSAFQPLFD